MTHVSPYLLGNLNLFTGLIVERGRLIADPVPSGQGGVLLAVGMSPELADRLAIGDSLAVSGVCLTVTETCAGQVLVELSPETLARTNLGELRGGAEVNLEPALRMGDPLGGHMVQGHVDGTAEVMERRDLEGHCELAFSIPPELAPFLVEKGSVTVDGVSLTVSVLRQRPLRGRPDPPHAGDDDPLPAGRRATASTSRWT